MMTYFDYTIYTVGNQTVNSPEEVSTQLLAWFATCCGFQLGGGLTNGALFVTVVYDRSSDICTRLLVGGLALGSLSYSTLCQFLQTLFYFLYIWNGYTIPCNGHYAVLCWLITGVSWSDVAVAFNRLVAIRYPQHYGKLRSLKVGIALLSVTWTYPTMVIAMVLADSSGIGIATTPVGSCIVVTRDSRGSLVNYTTVVLPYAATFALSLAILTTVSGPETTRKIGAHSAGQRNSLNKRLELQRLFPCQLCGVSSA